MATPWRNLYGGELWIEVDYYRLSLILALLLGLFSTVILFADFCYILSILSRTGCIRSYCLWITDISCEGELTQPKTEENAAGPEHKSR